MTNQGQPEGQLSAKKLELLRRLKMKKAGEEKETEAPVQLAALPRDGRSFPLSYAQQRLWFLTQFSDDASVAYNLPIMFRITGSLNTAALVRSLNQIVARHEALRTRILVQDDTAVQQIAPHTPFDLEQLDLRPLSGAEQEAAVDEQVRAVLTHPFDLGGGLLLYGRLLTLSEQSHLLLLVIHHIAFDGWSTGVFFQELSALYRANLTGETADLPELTIQYADYAHWQREWLQGQRLEEQLDYWRQQLSGAPPLLELPTDWPRPAVQRYRGARLQGIFSPELSGEIQALSRREEVTLFATLLAAFNVLLSRYSGEGDISIGSPVANRPQEDTRRLIGFFVNTLVLRTDLSDNPTFRELLKRVHDVIRGGYGRQDLPFERLVEALQPARNMSHNPLFQVMFSMQNVPRGETTFADLSIEPLEIAGETAQFDLTLYAMETDRGLVWLLEYNTDLFAEATMARFMGHYERLLTAVTANAGQPVQAISLLPEEERHHLLTTLARTDQPYPARLLHQWFEIQAAANPERTAVTFEGTSLTYGDLEARANQFARYLQRQGVGPETLVAVYVERTAEMVAALLGILKAGGAYLPLDPIYPPDRIAYMMDNSRAAFFVTEESFRGRLPEHEAVVIYLDSDRAAWEVLDTSPPPILANSDNLAYIIYTSGSTGRPKGVQISHRTVGNFLFGMLQRPGLAAGDVVLAETTLSFDISVLELFLPLCVGARIALVNRETASDPTALQEALDASGATVLQATPATFRMLITADWPGKADLVVMCGGEALAPDLAGSLLSRCRAVWNMYGPTETTVWATVDQVMSATEPITIGTAIPNAEMYVLDGELEPVPIGVPGELYIGGAGLSRGYFGRPSLSAKSFIPHPFASQPGARLYKTGDLVRWRQDGRLDYIGRADFQVKVRGFRIELGEIEARLNDHPAIEQAVVIAREDRPGSKQLAAYLTTRAGVSKPAVRELRGFLKKELPEYMVPSAFLFMETLPLTPNGKINRKALPAPAPDVLESSEGFVLPRTPIEETMAVIWAQVLRRERVGIHDNFFELGGHSLLAAQVMSRVRQTLTVELSLPIFFQAPTVAGLAEHVQSALWSQQGIENQPIPRIGRDGPLPLSFGQERLWYLYQLAPNSPAYNVAGVFRISGPLQVDPWRESIQAVVQRHEILRTAFTPAGEEPGQLPAERLKLEVEVVDLGPLSPADRQDEVQRLAKTEAQKPFRLETHPLLRIKLLALGEQEHVLLFTAHHAIFDAWSMGIFMRELAQLYEAKAAGETAVLPEITHHYADYAHWQRQWLQGETLEKQMAYWLGRLDNDMPVLELPLDRPRPAVQTFQGDRVHFQIPGDVSQQIKNLAQEENATTYMVLLAAFNTLLHHYTRQEDITIGSPITNRNRVEIEDMIGFFVNTLVLRTYLSGQPTFQQLLQRVREVVIGGYTHQDLPFEMLVERLQPTRHASYNPLFQVMFALQNAPGGQANFSDLNLSYVESESGSSHFDMTFSLHETAEGIAGLVDYNTDIFNRETILRLTEHFKALLDNIAADPGRKINQLSALSAEERSRILWEWNDTGSDFPVLRSEASLHQLFERQAAERPSAMAVVVEKKALTYGQLNQQANRLARRLQKLGVGAGDYVGICMPRSVDMITAVVAVLKVGAGYVPLDPGHPAERLTFMLNDTQAPVLLTYQSVVNDLPDYDGQIVHFENLDLDDEDAANLDLAITADFPAYIIYTSGSTGKPKGVMVGHRSVINLSCGFIEAHDFGPGERVLVIPPLSFDASVGDIFPCLLSGAAMVFHPNPGELTGSTLQAYCQQYAITAIDTAASLWRQWVDDWNWSGEKNVLPGLNFMMVGGESVAVEKLTIWSGQTSRPVAFYNHYGPTEATVCTTLYRTKDGAELSVSSLPIGRPLPNTQVYLLNKHLQPVPTGVPGELYIGGGGVTWGYWNRPDLTAVQFMPDPFSTEPGGRLYATGDWARYLPDGNIEFLGRIDHQIKIRGFRMEPGEIEAVIRQYPVTQETLVTVYEEPSGIKRLVGYVQSGVEALDTADLRQFLRERLPHYMVPDALVNLDAFPLTANGKIDRKSLPAPQMAGDQDGAAFVAPRTQLEEEVAAIWAEVMERTQVSIQDDFFNVLGGHSLLAIRLMSRLNAIMGLDLPLSTLFEAPTVADFSRVVAAVQSGSYTAESLDLRAEVVLDKAIYPPAVIGRNGDHLVKAVFLTGGTGFLGGFLLRELLERTDTTVYCLVRAENGAAGQRRIEGNLARYGLLDGVDTSRIVALDGDLAEPLLGLTAESFNELAQTVDVIYHNGGRVDFILPYDHLKAANVDGTHEVLRLAAQSRLKAVHFVSTLGLFLTPAYDGRTVTEQETPNDVEGLTKGYEQSKWVAEQLCLEARRRGIPVNIYRPARVTGDSRTGAANTNDLFYSLIKGVVQMGSAPLTRNEMDMYPVDTLSQAIIHLSRQEKLLNRNFHFFNPHTLPLSQITDSLRQTGFAVELMPMADWVEELQTAVSDNSENALVSFSPMLTGKQAYKAPSFDMSGSWPELEKADIVCPPADVALLEVYIDYLVQTGFLEAAPVAGG